LSTTTLVRRTSREKAREADVVRPELPEVTDEELERRWRAGSETAFGDLFRRHYPRAVAFAQRVLVDRSSAEDVAQAALLRIYETSRGKAGQFGSLVLTTTRNLALNEIRRRGRRHAAKANLEGVEPHASGELPPDEVARGEESERLRRALDTLEGEERDAFALRRDGKNYHEIATVMGLHPDAVRRRVARALEVVRNALSSARRIP
jgi:RNA polymerase sigma-70 factor (ECF subfamily)